MQTTGGAERSWAACRPGKKKIAHDGDTVGAYTALWPRAPGPLEDAVAPVREFGPGGPLLLFGREPEPPAFSYELDITTLTKSIQALFSPGATLAIIVRRRVSRMAADLTRSLVGLASNGSRAATA